MLGVEDTRHHTTHGTRPKLTKDQKVQQCRTSLPAAFYDPVDLGNLETHTNKFLYLNILL